ncbi:hypothetical protein B484DRAFT_253643, partial [Ochromonadaceae sp. CCMP2298]
VGTGAGGGAVSGDADLILARRWNEALLLVAIESLYPKALSQMRKYVEALAQASGGGGGGSGGGDELIRLRVLSGFYKYLPYHPRLSSAASRILSASTLWTALASGDLFLKQAGFCALRGVLLPPPDRAFPPQVVHYLLPMGLGLSPPQLTADLIASRVRCEVLTPNRLRQALCNPASLHMGRLSNNLQTLLPLLEYAVSDMQYGAQGQGGEGQVERADSWSAPTGSGSGGGIGESTESDLRRLYKALAGVPLLPVANNSVRCFPRNASEQVASAPMVLHELLPALKGHFLHPVVADTQTLGILRDPLFADSLFLSPFNAGYLEHKMHYILPAQWRGSLAVQWCSDDGAGAGSARDTVSSLGRLGAGVGAGGVQMPPPSAVLMYILWNTFLNNEDMAGLRRLQDHPLVPCVSGGRRVLLSVSLLGTVFSAAPSAAQEQGQLHLKREVGRLSALASASEAGTGAGAGSGAGAGTGTGTGLGGVGEDPWAWTTRPAVSGAVFDAEVGEGTETEGVGAEGAEGGDSSDSDYDDTLPQATTVPNALAADVMQVGSANPATFLDTMTATALTTGNGEEGEEIAAAAAVLAGEGTADRPHAVDFATPPAFAATAIAATAAAATAATTAAAALFPPRRGREDAGLHSASALVGACAALGLPFLDSAVLQDTPRALDGGPGGAVCADFSGRRLLHAISRLDKLDVFIERLGGGAGNGNTGGGGNADSTNGDGDSGNGIGNAVTVSLLLYDALSHAQRALLLGEIYSQHLLQPLSAQEQSMLKELRLFSVEGGAVALADCTNGAYWCTQEGVLADIFGEG